MEQNGWDEGTPDLVHRLGHNSVGHLEAKDELKRSRCGLTDESSSVTSCVLTDWQYGCQGG